MAKNLVSASVVVLALTLSSPAFAAVGGSNPTPQVRVASPQAVGGSNPTPQAVGGSNPTPQAVSWWTLVLSALGF